MGATDSPSSRDPQLSEQAARRMGNAMRDAWKESFGRRGLQMLNPLNLFKFPVFFLKNYVKESLNIKSDREKLRADTTGKLTEGLLQLPTEKLAGRLTSEFAKDAELNEQDAENADEIEDIDLFTTSLFDGLKSSNNAGLAVSGFDKIRKAANEKQNPKDLLKRDEATELTAVGILTLANLKEKFESQDELEEYLLRLEELAKRSKKAKNFLNYLTTNFTTIFKADLDQIPKVLGISDAKVNRAMKARDKAKAVSELIAQEAFPKSSEVQTVETIGDFLRIVLKKGGKMNIKQIAEFAFLIETTELEELAMKVAPPKKYRIDRKAA